MYAQPGSCARRSGDNFPSQSPTPWDPGIELGPSDKTELTDSEMARSPPAGPESSHLKQWSSFPQQVVTKQDIVHTQKEKKKITVSEGLSVLHLNSVHFKKAFLEANLHVVQTNMCPQVPSLLQYLQLGAFSTHHSTFSFFFTSSSLRVTHTETCP